MKTTYFNIHYYLPDEFQEIAYSAIDDYSFTGIEEKFDEIIITFSEQFYNNGLEEEILEKLLFYCSSARHIKTENIEDKNWNEEWEKNVPSIIVNENIAIAPSWKINELTQKIKIEINPKMSFGTGDHPTTRLVCRLLEKYVKPDSFWIDVGTGTGVLAILSVMLGAEKAFAFDNNIWSVENAKENFLLNYVSEKIELQELDIDSIYLPDCDGISANIFLHLAKSGMKKFYDSLRNKQGVLLLSGILSYDKEIIIDIAKENGFILIEEIFEEEWAAFVFKAIH